MLHPRPQVKVGLTSPVRGLRQNFPFTPKYSHSLYIDPALKDHFLTGDKRAKTPCALMRLIAVNLQLYIVDCAGMIIKTYEDAWIKLRRRELLVCGEIKVKQSYSHFST